MKKVFKPALCVTYVWLTIFLFATGTLSASLYTFSGNANNNGTYGPVQKCDAKWIGQAMIYPSSGFNSGGGFGTITTVGFNIVGSGSSLSIPIKVYLKAVGATTTLSGTPTWASAISGATLVFSGNTPNTFAAGNWYDITLNTSFPWSSGNLEVYVECDWAQVTGCGTSPVWAYNNAAGTDQEWNSNTSANALQSAAGMAVDQYRPDIRINVTAPPPPPTITTFTPASACSGSGASVVISGTNFTGATAVSFNGVAATYTVDNAGQITATLPAGATTGTISVTTGGGTATSSTSFTVNPLPANPGNPTSNSPQCANPGVTITPTGAIPGAETWYWETTAGGTSTANSSGSYSVTALGNTSVYIRSQNNTTGCWSAGAGSVSVTVNNVPAQPGTITGSTIICGNSTNTYSVTAVNGATSYTWTLPNGWTGTSTTNSISATADASGGTISVTADNTCGSSTTQTLAVTISTGPAQPGAITGSTSVCDASTGTYSVASVNGATSYTWTLPNGWTGTSTTNSISATAGPNGGTISVTADNTCGSSPAQTLAVSISSGPATPGPINGLDTVCGAGSYSYSIPSVSGATSYTWTLPNGWTGTSTSIAISPTSGTTGGTISVTADNSCGSSAPQTLDVYVIPTLPTPGTITGPDSLCNGSQGTFAVVPVSGATSYTWTLPSGWSGGSATESIDATAATTPGNITVVANNACGSSNSQTHAVTISSAATTPGSINGPASICASSVNTYSVADVGALSYTWTLPNGWSGTSTTNTISATADATGGDITVIANSSCGSSSPQTLTINIATAPSTPTSINGPATFCSGSINTYSVATVNGATGYTWTLPNGWSGTSTTETISATAGSTGGDITITADNACGSSTAQTLTVTSTSAPATPGTISGPATICSGGANTYSISTVNGATGYTWTLPNGWTGSSVSETISAVSNATGGDILVTADNACGSSTAQTLTVTIGAAPSTPGTINGPATICSGSTNTYSVTTVNGATGYTWTLPNGWTGTSVSETISAVSNATGGDILVTADNACGSSTAQTLTVTIGTSPATPGTITGPGALCNGSSDNYSIATVGAATGYTWTLPSGWSGTSGTESIAATAGSAGGSISVTADNSCGSSTPQTLTVSVNPLPSVSFDLNPGTMCLNAAPLTLSSGTPAGGTYSGQGVSGGVLDPTGLSASTYILTYAYTDGNNCSASDTAAIAMSVCSGINNVTDNNFEVYPNPFNGQLTLNQNSLFGKGTVIIRDVTGQEAMRLQLPVGTNTYSINTSALAKGVYMLDIIIEGKTSITKKLIRME